jgi:hypothetical protein
MHARAKTTKTSKEMDLGGDADFSLLGDGLYGGIGGGVEQADIFVATEGNGSGETAKKDKDDAVERHHVLLAYERHIKENF